MVAVLERSGSPPPPTGVDAEDEQYSCDCPGFKALDVMQMCLRCLEAYTAGLEHANLSAAIVEREMRRAARRLAVLLKNDPLIANLPAAAVLRKAR